MNKKACIQKASAHKKNRIVPPLKNKTSSNKKIGAVTHFCDVRHEWLEYVSCADTAYELAKMKYLSDGLKTEDLEQVGVHAIQTRNGRMFYRMKFSDEDIHLDQYVVFSDDSTFSQNIWNDMSNMGDVEYSLGTEESLDDDDVYEYCETDKS